MLINTFKNLIVSSEEFRNTTIQKPSEVIRFMSWIFFCKVFFLVVSVISAASLFILKPESILYYLLSSFCLIWSFISVCKYSEYFALFFEHYRLYYSLLNKICEMPLSDAREYLDEIHLKEKFLNDWYVVNDLYKQYEKDRT